MQSVCRRYGSRETRRRSEILAVSKGITSGTPPRKRVRLGSSRHFRHAKSGAATPFLAQVSEEHPGGTMDERGAIPWKSAANAPLANAGTVRVIPPDAVRIPTDDGRVGPTAAPARAAERAWKVALSQATEGAVPRSTRRGRLPRPSGSPSRRAHRRIARALVDRQADEETCDATRVSRLWASFSFWRRVRLRRSGARPRTWAPAWERAWDSGRALPSCP